MTLSVLIDLGSGLEVRNPSAEIETNPRSRNDIVRFFRLNRDTYCPHCYAKTNNLSKVRFVGAEKKRVHFAHEVSKSGGGCPHATKESERHIDAKARIAESLKICGLACEVSIDRDLIETEGSYRKPDVLAVYPNGAIEAHEVQISKITFEQLVKRTEDLRLQCAKVVWYLGTAMLTDENRSYLRSLSNVDCYRLTFESDNADFPVWGLDDKPIKTQPKKAKIGAIDACSTVSAGQDQPSKTVRLVAEKIVDAAKTSDPQPENIQPQKPKVYHRQIELIDLSVYSSADLTGSHNDDFEDVGTVRKRGKKSKYDPTWDMDSESLREFAASFRDSVERSIQMHPKPLRDRDCATKQNLLRPDIDAQKYPSIGDAIDALKYHPLVKSVTIDRTPGLGSEVYNVSFKKGCDARLSWDADKGYCILTPVSANYGIEFISADQSIEGLKPIRRQYNLSAA